MKSFLLSVDTRSDRAYWCDSERCIVYRDAIYRPMESRILSVAAADIRFPTSLDKDGSDAIASICKHAENAQNDYTRGHSKNQ